MLRRGFLFEYEIPDNWEEYREGNQYVYHGPYNVELIISGSILQGTGSAEELETVKKRLIVDGIASMRTGAAHPDLVTIDEPTKINGFSELDCWTMASKTADGATLFFQGIFFAEFGTLLVTFECDNRPEAGELFQEFLRGVRKARGFAN